MEIKSLYNNRLLGLIFISIEILIEHAQIMSFLRDAYDPNGDAWNSDADDAFDILEDLTLRYDGSTFAFFFILATAVTCVTFSLYLIFCSKLHDWNKQSDSLATPFIWFCEHIIYGIGFVPIIAQFVEVQFCDDHHKVYGYDDIDCFTTDHLILIEIGFVLTGIALFMAGVVFPILKSERNGIEKRWENEGYYPGMHKAMLVGIVFLIAPVRLPYTGIILTVCMIAYLLYSECFSEIQVASMHMAVLFAQLWVFICMELLKEDGDLGSDMLAGWIPLLIFGYLILPIKARIFGREFKTLPIDK